LVLNWSFGGFKIKAFGVDFCIKMLSSGSAWCVVTCH
jgi:hypothetical protein